MCEVSVAMSIYNGERYLESAIESILNQTYSNFEFIICDDASTDTTVSIVKRYMEKDNRIVLIQNIENIGLAESLNKCIELSKGKYIARMDSDDISFLDRFKKQVSYLDENPDIAFVCGGVHFFDEGGIWGSNLGSKTLDLKNVFKNQPIAHPTVMIRKEVLHEVNNYTVAPYTRRGQDFDLWCKIYHKGFIGANIGEYVLYYRNNKEAYGRRKFKNRIDTFKLKKKWRKELGLPFIYEIYVYKPIIAGLIPSFIMRKYHSLRFYMKKTNV